MLGWLKCSITVKACTQTCDRVPYHTGLESLQGSDVLSIASPEMRARSHLQSLLGDPAGALPAALHSCLR